MRAIKNTCFATALGLLISVTFPVFAESLNVTLPGSFNSELGCGADWDPSCQSMKMDGPNADGNYTYTTSAIPTGSYEFKIAIDYSWNENYGAGGVRDGANIPLSVNSGNVVEFVYHPDTHIVVVSRDGVAPFSSTEGMWLSKDLIAVKKGSPSDTFKLEIAPLSGNLEYAADGKHIQGAEKITTLTYLRTLSPATDATILAKWPFLEGLNVLQLDKDANGTPFANDTAKLNFVREALKRNVGIEVTSSDNAVIEATQLQIAEVIDDVYGANAANQPQGVVFDAGHSSLTLNLWAPTAVVVYAIFGPNYDYAPMTQDTNTGIWSTASFAKSDLDKQFYFYCVQVYSRYQKRMLGDCEGFVHNNDPYAPSMTLNQYNDSQPYSQVLDLDDSALKPATWATNKRPNLPSAFEDDVIYELHVRDFSANLLNGVPSQYIGLYKAFTVNSAGKNHLENLAKKGLTHVQIMPIQDFSSVNENHSTILTPDVNILNSFPSNSTGQSEYLLPFIKSDAFNWGYDPMQYFVPEGSYATDPSNGSRILEFREMVDAIHNMGLGVNLDMVVTHFGGASVSALDRIVPDYYYSLVKPNEPFVNGKPLPVGSYWSFFGPIPESSNKMVARLIKDSILNYVKNYKVDGFRMDGMFYSSKAFMTDLRKTFDQMTLAKDGVDGKKIMLYGEGIEIYEVKTPYDYLFASTTPLAGSNIGSFNTATSWAVHGSSFLDGKEEPRGQGFINGLGYDDTGYVPVQESLNTKEEVVAQQIQMIQVGLTGNLADYQFSTGEYGRNLMWDGYEFDRVPGTRLVMGVAKDPAENISTASVHDGRTLFDTVMIKAPLTQNLDARIRMHNMGISLAMLSQGVPFLNAGDDFLRSKSLDANSYDSGDWYNAIDFTLNTNNWTHGMPITSSSDNDKSAMQTVHDAFLLGPTKAQMQRAQNHFYEMLNIRKTIPLFRLRNAADINQSLKFYDVGNRPGLIAMKIEKADDKKKTNKVVVLFNANKDPVTFKDAKLAKSKLELHPAQVNSDDPIVRKATFDKKTGTFYVPARTTAVFIEMQ